MIRNKIDEYLDRAEKLKEHLDKKNEKKSRRAVGANGSAGSVGGSAKKYALSFSKRPSMTDVLLHRKDSDDDDDMDPELKKLRAGLSGM